LLAKGKTRGESTSCCLTLRHGIFEGGYEIDVTGFRNGGFFEVAEEFVEVDLGFVEDSLPVFVGDRRDGGETDQVLGVGFVAVEVGTTGGGGYGVGRGVCGGPDLDLVVVNEVAFGGANGIVAFGVTDFHGHLPEGSAGTGVGRLMTDGNGFYPPGRKAYEGITGGETEPVGLLREKFGDVPNEIL